MAHSTQSQGEGGGMNEQALMLIDGGLDNISLEARAQRIRDLVSVARGCIIEIGRELIAASESDEIKHRGWEEWLISEFGWSDVTARKHMRVARAFHWKSGSQSSEPLTIEASALYLLSAPEMRQEVREQAVTEAQNGKRVTIEEAEKMVANRVAQEIERLRETLREQQAATPEASEPTINDAIALMCKLTNRKKLTPRQMQSLAHAMQKTIQYGGAVYTPITEEEARQSDVAVRATSDLMRALAFFDTAMPPADLMKLAPDYVRASLDTVVPRAREWLAECELELKGKQNAQGRRNKR
jgi:hypothetical protein